MQQQHEIRWGGMTTTPSDHSTPDGDTAISQNLISENGELRPIMPPKVAFTITSGQNLLDEDGKPLNLTHTLKGTGTLHALHQIGSQNLYIIGYQYGDGQYRLGYGLYACVVVDGSPRFHSIVYEAKGVIRPVDVVIMGNTIVLSYATGLVFSVYRKGEGYRALGDKPMQLNMGFGMSKNITPKEIKIAFSKNGDASAFAFAGDVSTRGIQELQVFWSKYWEAIASIKEKQEHGVFFHPIFVRYAYRINTEGKVHTLQSPPILLFPSSKDIAYITNVEDQTDENKEDYTKYAWCSLWLSYGELYYTLQHSVSEMRNLVEAWKDIITEVDVFISAPITNIKQDDELKRCVKINNENSDYLPIWATPSGVDKFKDIFIDSFIVNWDTYASLWNTDENGNKWPQYYVDIPHYTKEDMRERIESASQFYRVATIKLSDMLQEVEDTQRVGIVDGVDIPDDKVISTYTSPLHIPKEVIETLQQREVLEDDFDSHLTKTSEVVSVYNARLYLANVSKSLFPGYYPEVMFDHSENHYNGPGEEVHHYDVYTYFTKGGKEYITKHSSNSQDCYTRNYLPFIFVPDTDATKMVVVNKSQGEVRWAKKFHLTPHKYLNGAFYFNDLLASFGEEINPFEPPQNIVDANRIFSQTPNQLLASEVNTPFYFPISSREYVGVGEIRALAPVSVALSQGQVGQFPLYALTDEGTWALSIADDGRLSAKQAATRDVIISKETLLQMDGALAFVTEQGIVFLSGVESSVISSILDYPKMSIELKGISVFDKLKHLVVEHREYWKGCRLAFDYSEKKLIVFNPDPNYEYSYVFSNTSQQWATIPRKYMYAINHYPTSLLVGAGETPNVYDISTRDEYARVDAVVVSRPVKMGLPDVLKTLTNVVHRGSGGSITTAVYGSVDGKHFHLLGSSKNKFLRKLHGTPYKEFIFVVAIGEMAKSDYLLGSSITFQPKRTNKLR